jgi:hypothetical protein
VSNDTQLWLRVRWEIFFCGSSGHGSNKDSGLRVTRSAMAAQFKKFFFRQSYQSRVLIVSITITTGMCIPLIAARAGLKEYSVEK